MLASPRVTSEEIDAYTGMIEAHAFRFSRLPEMQNEYDDFCQEGRIAVWFALRDGYPPSNKIVTDRMSNVARSVRRKGFGGYDQIPEDVAA